MAKIVCPKCNKTYFVADHCGDFSHECSSADDTIKEEDVMVIGDWEDYSGSGTAPTQVTAQAGLANTLQGTIAGNKGEYFGGVTDRGNNKQLYRQRPRLHYTELYSDTAEC